MPFLLEGSTVATLLFALSQLAVNRTGTTKFYDKATITAKGHLGGPDWPNAGPSALKGLGSHLSFTWHRVLQFTSRQPNARGASLA